MPQKIDKYVAMEEYKEANQNMRHFSNQRIGALTVSLALNGVLLDGTLKQGAEPMAIVMAAFGVISVVYFLVFDTRVADYYYVNRDRAREIERGLKMKLYKESRERKPIIGVTNLTKVLYAGIFLLWCFILVPRICGCFQNQ